MCTDRHDDDIDATHKCRVLGSVILFTNIVITPNLETYIMPESEELFTNIKTARPQYAVNDAFIKTPGFQQFNTPFAQIDF